MLELNIDHMRYTSSVNALRVLTVATILQVFTVTSRNRKLHLRLSCKFNIKDALTTSKMWDSHLICLCLCDKCTHFSEFDTFQQMQSTYRGFDDFAIFYDIVLNVSLTTYHVRIWVETVEMRLFAETVKVWIHSPTTFPQQSSTSCL